MIERLTRNRKKFSNLFLVLASALVFSFVGLFAYVYFQFSQPLTNPQLSQTDPQLVEMKDKIGLLYNDQRTLVSKFASTSRDFIDQSVACGLRVPENIPESKKDEFLRLQFKIQDFAEKMRDKSREFIATAFEPFFGAGLDEEQMMKESLLQLQVFMKGDEIKRPCNDMQFNRLKLDQDQLVVAISNNADEAKNLLINYKLTAALTK